MMFEICAATDVGCRRKNNEDGFYINKMGCCDTDKCFIYKKFDTPVLAFAADGVGGTKAGEEAARICADIAYKEPIPYDDNDLIALIDKMNSAVNEARRTIDTACTIAGVLLGDDCLYWFNIGDSRVYAISKGYLHQLSVDDTVSGLYGEISENKEPLLQYIGKDRALPHIKEIEDIVDFMICTDGLTDLVSLDEIENIFRENTDIREITGKLIELSKQNGGYDNITVIIIRPLEEDKDNG